MIPPHPGGLGGALAVPNAASPLHHSGNNLSDRKRRAIVLHYADARSRWLNDPSAQTLVLLVAGREYPGGL